MSPSLTRRENVHFLYYAIKRVWMAAGAEEEHAHYVADAIAFAHKQGKLNQGLGVYEALDIALEMNLLDIGASPEVIDEGPTWATVDGRRSSGYWCLNVMADLAIEKAREYGIAIVFGGNHNDAGSFARYVYKAFEQDMMAFSSNNTVPLAAPFGGMRNRLSCAPFDAIVPAGREPPIWASVALAEFYDADVSEAAIHNKPLKGKWLIDPQTGELSDDVKPYAQPIEGYGRVWGCSAAGQIDEPRTYALNMWNEAMTAIINPIGVPSTALPTVDEVVRGGAANTSPTVGGSYYLCIDPAKFGPIDDVKARSDAYVSAIENCPPRPGHSVRLPGSGGYRFLQENEEMVEVLANHWKPFFVTIAGRYGLNEASLRTDFEKLRTGSFSGSGPDSADAQQ
jgi:LDH2 family malate/lactate/ureidoglycolate dehydrogenase